MTMTEFATLEKGRPLECRDGDYLFSPKRLYFGMIEPGGRFVVYRGTGPSDKHDEVWSVGGGMQSGWEPPHLLIFGGPNQRGEIYPTYLFLATTDRSSPPHTHALWRSDNWSTKDRCRAVIQDDGNFCVYGKDSSDKLFWQSRFSDPLVDFEIQNIVYDIANAKVLSSVNNISLDSLTLENPHPSEKQTSSISRTVSASHTTGWSDQFGLKVGTKTNFKTGVPFIAEGKVEVSLEASYTYTWNGSDQNTESFTWSAPVVVGPRERGHVLVTASKSKIEVPYSLKGEVVFKSGKRFSRALSGIYTGENAHNVKVTMSFEKLDPSPTAIERGRTEVIPATVTFRRRP